MRRRGLNALLCGLALVLAGCGGLSRADFEQVANGEEASRDRVAVAAMVRDELATLASAMPWLDWRAHSVDQECSPASAGLIKQSYWLRCMTSVIVYAGYDGDLLGAIQRFDDTVIAAHWGNIGSSAAGMIDYYRSRPAGSPPHQASDLPDVRYSGPTTPCGTALTLSQRWLEAGQPLTAEERAEPQRLPESRPVYERLDPLDHVAVKTELLAQHQYVAVVTFGVQCDYDVGD
jgi:hypothetical protein